VVSVPRTVYIVINCDVDPDREGFLDGVPHGTLTWRGLTEGIPAVKNLLHGLTDSVGREPAFTWMLRADEQIRELQGEYGWVVRTQSSLLRSLQQSGDELGWHPHFWRREAPNQPWFQELEDVDWQVGMLQRAHRDLSASFPGAIQSVRMGWAYHNNRTYAALEQLGLKVDLSALPGYRTLTGTPPRRSENLFDWYRSPRAPFWPSRSDYRRAVQGGETASRLLQVPSFVSESIPWSLVSGLQLARKTRNIGQIWSAIRRPSYCINVTARPVYFAPLAAQLRSALRRVDHGPLVFATQFHADELLPNRGRLYDIQGVRTNLAAVVRACDDTGIAARFVQACQIPALWSD
jgi:hypothetical protein